MKGKEWMIFPGMCFTVNTGPSGPSNLHLCHWKYAPYVFMSSRFSVLGAYDLQFGKARYNRMNGILYSKNIQKKSKKLLCSKACIILHCGQIIYCLSYQGMPMVVIEMANCYKSFIHLLSISVSVNGNPLQNSCLESPMYGGAWWAAVCGVAQSWTRLKWLSSSSNN